MDMLAYAIDNQAPATIVLISGDPAFAYVVSVLRHRRYRVTVVGPPNVHMSLKSQASALVNWNCDILRETDADLNAAPSLENGSGPVTRSNLEQNAPLTISHPPSPRMVVGDTKRTDHTVPLSVSGENSKNQHDAKVGISNQRVSSWLWDDSGESGRNLGSKRLVPLPSTNTAALDDSVTPPMRPSFHKQFSSELTSSIAGGHTSGILGRFQPHLTSVVGHYGRFEPKGKSAITGMPRGPERPSVSQAQVIPGMLKNTRIPSSRTVLPMAESRAQFETGDPPKSSSMVNSAAVSGGDLRITSNYSSGVDDLQTSEISNTSVLVAETYAAAEPAQQSAGNSSKFSLPDREQLVLPANVTCNDEAFIMPKISTSSVASTTSSFLTSANVRTSPSTNDVSHPPSSPVPSNCDHGTFDETTSPIHLPKALEVSSANTKVPDNPNVPSTSKFDVLKTLPVGTATQTNVYPISPTSAATSSGSEPRTSSSSISNYDCITKSAEVTSEKLPPVFDILVEQLDQQMQQGVLHPLRSVIAEGLMKQDPSVYARAGVSKFRQYISLACKAGVVSIGGVNGNEWVSLTPLHQAHITSRDVAQSLSPHVSVGQAEDATASRQTLSGKTTPIAEAPCHQGLFESPMSRTDHGTTNPAASSVVTANSDAPDSSSSTALAATENSTPSTSPEGTLPGSAHSTFGILVEILRQYRSRGCFRPSRSVVAIDLAREDALYAQRLGVNKFKEYIALAVKAQVVIIGHTDSDAWISLHPAGQGTEALHTSEATAFSSASSLSSRFRLLVEQLTKARLGGVERPLRSAIGYALLGQNKSVYQDAGFNTFKEYVTAAEEAGVVQLGGTNGHAWISLCTV